jgi:3-hydroxybutyryl-CoA dehydrogenase
MTIAIVNDNGTLDARIRQISDSEVEWLFCTSAQPCPSADAAVVLNAPDAWIQQLSIPALVGETNRTLAQMGLAGLAMGRFCAWPTFLERNTWEVAANAAHLPPLQTIAQALQVALVPVLDAPGLVAPRIIACIVNEACYGLQEQICTPQHMDIAMKLGTNYPYGPVEWMEKIGKPSIASLLQSLAMQSIHYTPHPLLLSPSAS